MPKMVVHRKMVVDCPLVITFKVKPFSRPDKTRKDEWIAPPVFCIVDTGSCYTCSSQFSIPKRKTCSADQEHWKHWNIENSLKGYFWLAATCFFFILLRKSGGTVKKNTLPHLIIQLPLWLESFINGSWRCIAFACFWHLPSLAQYIPPPRPIQKEKKIWHKSWAFRALEIFTLGHVLHPCRRSCLICHTCASYSFVACFSCIAILLEITLKRGHHVSWCFVLVMKFSCRNHDCRRVSPGKCSLNHKKDINYKD